MHVAETICRVLDAPFVVERQTLQVSASIGIALTPAHGDDAQTLLRRADVAMYAAKQTHTGYVTYSPEVDGYSPERLTLAGALRMAIQRDELVLHYQPKVDLSTRRVVGVEALVRWQHPGRGLLYPDRFIPIAEGTGLIVPLTQWVLNAALRQCRAWRDQGVDITMSVNCSMANIQDPELPEILAMLLRIHELPPDRLCIELTESTVMADAAGALAVLTRLSALGIKIAVDDFGTGYSSLAYLKRLPVDELKIDKSFVLHMADDDTDRVIVTSIVGIACALGIDVVAEGVENEAAWTQLAALQCQTAQGYYISRPLPPQGFLEWLRMAAPSG